ncbi:hypothetical protein JS87_15990 [Vibrio vulnificus]|nr:hypothetical protein JS87_15990 [Vibrio vulnificus]HAT8499797.1 glycosyltransferase [Vibrio vulnificus]HDY8227272.1 glycosyltransferase family 4 protein [Vibrio vulnificus]
MKKIAFITERNLSSNSNGSSMRDLRLLELLREKYEVDIFYNNIDKSKLGMFRCFKTLPNEIKSVINSSEYHKVIVSTFIISPFFLSYARQNNVIYYLCDSSFHIASQFLSIKSKILSIVLSMKEFLLLTFFPVKGAYLGSDEIKYIPKFLKSKAIIFPFHMERGEYLYNENGYITFVGDFSFLPNKIALKNIVDYARRSNFKFKVFGSNIPSDFSYPKNVEVVGYVNNIKDAYDGARALIYPVVYGTGIKNKVIEAMSFGIPVVGYKEAFTNLDFKESIKIVKNTPFSDEYFVNLSKNSISSYEFVFNELSKKSVSEKIFKEIDK